MRYNLRYRKYRSFLLIKKLILLKIYLVILSINNHKQLSELKGKIENLWKRYHRAKTEDKKNEIFAEINYIQPKIKELYKYDKYCKEIIKRAEGIQNNLNNFDKDIQKEKDNSRSI